jgi:hypothetical protein
VWCLGGCPRVLPAGRSQAGDRPLNFHELRDNLWNSVSLPLPHVLIPSIIASLESFSAGMFIQAVESQIDGSSSLHQGLWEENRDHTLSSMVSIAKYWKAWFSVDYGDADPHWSRIQAFGHVRNAIVHGTGQLTPKQASRASTVKAIRELARFGVTLTPENRLDLNEDSLESCGETAIAHIDWLDRKVSPLVNVAVP